MSSRVYNLLFLCTGNSARSIMAEVLLRRWGGDKFRAFSAGSHPKPLHPDAIRVMAEQGIDIADRRSKHLDRFAQERFDRVITLCDKVREVCPTFPEQPTTAHWSMADPAADNAETSYPTFVATVEEIEWRISLLIAELAWEAVTKRSTR